MSKYYVVVRGKVPGIYRTWAETQAMISGYSGAVHKSFKTEKEAQEFYTKSKPSVNIDYNTIIYTDGSGRGNENSCGFGVVIIGKEKYEAYGKVPRTVYKNDATNNVAELYAIYIALSLSNDSNILIKTDSNYSIDCCTVWIHEWLKTGRSNVDNYDLVYAIYNKMKNRNIGFQYVEAHSGIEYNEKADQLANQGRVRNDETIIINKF